MKWTIPVEELEICQARLIRINQNRNGSVLSAEDIRMSYYSQVLRPKYIFHLLLFFLAKYQNPNFFGTTRGCFSISRRAGITVEPVKQKYKQPTRCNNNNFINNFNQLNMFRAIISPILRSTKLCLQLVV